MPRLTLSTTIRLAALFLLVPLAADAEMRLSAQGIIYSARAGGGPIAVARSGDAYVLESAPSPDVPGIPGVFVIKLSPDGRSIGYRTFIGHGTGAGIAVDRHGSVFVTGTAFRADFPVTAGFTTSATSRAIFVARLDESGRRTYSVLVGGTDAAAAGVAIDGGGNAYVTGIASTSDFPTTAGAFDRVFHGGGGTTPSDVVIFKLNGDGTALVYSTYLGGSDSDVSVGIAVDAGGNVYVAGSTMSTNFPTTGAAFQAVRRSGSDAFVAKLNAGGNALVYSSYLGGAASDFARGIAIDDGGEAYVAGVTRSSDFPTTPGAERRTYAGTSSDGFVTKLDRSGTTVIYSTYLGGADWEELGGIVVDPGGYAFVTGATTSTDYPVTAGAVQQVPPGSEDAFVTRLSLTGTIVYSTYLGAAGADAGFHIALNDEGDVFASGRGGPDYLLTPQAATSVDAAADGDPFVTRLVPRVSRGRLAMASSRYRSTYPAAAAVDANFATRWSSAWSDAQWLVVDLGEQMDVDRVVLHWARADARVYVLQFSDDLQTWESRDMSGADGDGGIDDLRVVGLAAGRYVRINFSERDTAWGYSLWEVDVYGEPPGSSNLPPGAGILSPQNGWSFVGRTSFEVIAEARGQMEATVTKVNLWLNGQLIGTDTRAPWVFQLTVPDGSDQIQLWVTAEDDRGEISPISNVVTVHPIPSLHGENRARGRLAVASSAQGPTFPAANAVDGVTTTRWSSAFSDPQWLYVDLGQSYDVKTVVLRWETAYASSFDVQVSSDAQTWKTIDSASGTGGTQTLSIANAVGRYVRIYGHRRGTAWGYSLYEFEVYGDPIERPTTNVATGRPAFASSMLNASYAADAATDGVTTTRWSSAFEDNQWIYVDLGDLYDITRIVLRWEAAFAKDYRVEVSNDRRVWRMVRQVIDGDGGVDTFNGIASTARYVRLSGTRRATMFGLSLWEFEVYGAPAAFGPNLAALAPTSASSHRDAFTKAANAIDRDGSTRWSSAFADNQWIVIDLGMEVDIARVVLRWGAAYALSYAIQLSNDLEGDWRTALTIAAGDGGTDDLSISGRGRFVRVRCDRRATMWGVSLWEIEVYGPQAPSAVANRGVEISVRN